MSVLARIAEFLGFIADRQLTIERLLHEDRQDKAMAQATLQTIKDALAAQGTQLDKLTADRNAKEQADLDTIQAAIDANGAKFAAALAPAGDDAGTGGSGSDAGGGTAPTSSTVTVAGPSPAGSSVIGVTAGSQPVVGSTVAGPGIAAGTTLQRGSTDATLVLSQPIVAPHDGTETLTLTPPAQPAA